MDRMPQRTPERERGMSRWAMAACCAVPVLAVGALLATGTAGSGGVLLFAPLIGCLAMHGLMHRMTGRSCHAPAPRALPVPAGDERAVPPRPQADLG